MGEKKKKDKETKKHVPNPGSAPGAALLGLRFTAMLVVFCSGLILSDNGAFVNENDGKMSIVARLIFFVLAQATANEIFALALLQVARKMQGEPWAASVELTPEEKRSNDPTIAWPAKELLAGELKALGERKGQPFSLNHVTGRRRCKDTFMRIGMTMGSCLAVWCTCRWMDKRSIYSLGMTMDAPFFADMSMGFVVGVAIVAFTFAVELCMGWIKFLQFFEVFDKSESFAVCIFWDVVFHLNVALQEELPLRGWMLSSLAESFASRFGTNSVSALLLAMVVQSGFFVLMHLQSPGGMKWQSMVNIFIGGMAAGFNVLFTGGRLGFSLGWHFGWNITMGNVLGLSTSGIPISATFVSVAPDPRYARFHGDVFGPEGGVVAPFAYSLGILALFLIYGTPGAGAGLPTPGVAA